MNLKLDVGMLCEELRCVEIANREVVAQAVAQLYAMLCNRSSATAPDPLDNT